MRRTEVKQVSRSRRRWKADDEYHIYIREDKAISQCSVKKQIKKKDSGAQSEKDNHHTIFSHFPAVSRKKTERTFGKDELEGSRNAGRSRTTAPLFE